jgi:hypothetical protein
LHHQPLDLTTPASPPASPKGAASANPTTGRPSAKPADQAFGSTARWVCHHCKSVNLRVEYGYSYYFRCLQCGANTRISTTCKTCGGKERVRKSGDRFYLDCDSCGTSRLFHTNPEADRTALDPPNRAFFAPCGAQRPGPRPAAVTLFWRKWQRTCRHAISRYRRPAGEVWPLGWRG